MKREDRVINMPTTLDPVIMFCFVYYTLKLQEEERQQSLPLHRYIAPTDYSAGVFDLRNWSDQT